MSGKTVGEYDNGSAKSAGRTEYIWLPTDSGMPIPIGLYRGGQFYALHTDHLGTPRSMTNEANKPVWQWPYSAFGSNKPTGVLKATANPRAAITNKPVLLTATGAPEMNLGFPGQMRDVETGAFYNMLRDAYDANIGAYWQLDPIGLGGGLNRRIYAEANSLMLTDPMGLDPWWKDPSLKRMESNDQRVIDWLCKNGGAESPVTELMDARRRGFDRYDDNLAAAERFAEMMDGNYSGYSPWRSDDFNFGQYLFKSARNAFRGGKGNGSKDAGFVGKWGAMGAFNFEQRVDWTDWKKRNCTCAK